MPRIEDFTQVRADGKLIPAGMSVTEVLALDWPVCLVTALRWTYDGRPIEIAVPDGMLGIVVPGADHVAALWGRDRAHPCGQLVILSADGSRHGAIDDPIVVSGKEEFGWFGWFEPALTPRPGVFGAMFQTDRQGEVRCDIDAAALRLVATRKVS